MTFEEYLAQFAGVESSPEIIVQSDDDMQSFNAAFHERWANDHSKVIQEWRDMHTKDGECEDCNRCLKS